MSRQRCIDGIQVQPEAPEHPQCLPRDWEALLGCLHLVARALVRFLHEPLELGQVDRERLVQHLSDAFEQTALYPNSAAQDAPPQNGNSSSA